MAFRLTSYWKLMTNRLRGTAAYATATAPKLKSYAPTADFGHQEQQGRRKKALRGEYVPVYVAVGMIALSVSLGLYTAKQQIAYAPNVRVSKKRREMVAEVEDPDRVVEEADKFIKKSLFRKIAHIQEFDNGLNYRDPIRKDVYAEDKPRAITLKDVGLETRPQPYYHK